MSVQSAASKWTLPVRAMFVAVPVLGLGYQFCAVQIAGATASEPIGAGWLLAVLSQPWASLLVVLEICSFVAWMMVLSRVSISEAFPLTAVSYLLVVALGWFVFHEPVRLLQLVGAFAIGAGVYLVGRGGPSDAPH